MTMQEAKDRFIETWGSLGSKWGINRTMAQIHALLILTDDLLCTEDVMSELKISRGNANMNIRMLMDWGLVYKKLVAGDRREFFLAEKDMWLVTKRVIAFRRQKELEPVLGFLNDLKNSELEKSEEADRFKEKIEDISKFADQAGDILSFVSKSEESFFFKTMLKLMK